MKIKQVVPAPGWRLYEAQKDYENPSGPPVIDTVPVVGWGIVEGVDSDEVEILVYHDGIDFVEPLSEWLQHHAVDRELGHFAHFVASPDWTDDEAREVLASSFAEMKEKQLAEASVRTSLSK